MRSAKLPQAKNIKYICDGALQQTSRRTPFFRLGLTVGCGTAGFTGCPGGAMSDAEAGARTASETVFESTRFKTDSTVASVSTVFNLSVG